MELRIAMKLNTWWVNLLHSAGIIDTPTTDVAGVIFLAVHHAKVMLIRMNITGFLNMRVVALLFYCFLMRLVNSKEARILFICRNASHAVINVMA